MKINYRQLPVKAHYFFFMAAMGPILPFLPVYGKQLGISPIVMGSICAVLPILYLIAKPIFGFLADYFRDWRKSIFVAILATTCGCYVLMALLPNLPGPALPDYSFKNVSCATLPQCTSDDRLEPDFCTGTKTTTCKWSCDNGIEFSLPVYFQGGKEAEFSTNSTCIVDTNNSNCSRAFDCIVTCDDFENTYCLYTSATFWGFIFLMCVGNTGFNVCNSISDAICFDVLGAGGEMSYGRQRVWGTIGFGITAFLAGYAIDWWSRGEILKSYAPAFLLVFIFALFDLLCCIKLKLPIISGSSNILKDVLRLLKLKPIAIFLCFATLAGILDSFLIYFLFWYLEDLAIVTGHMGEIKLIEGLIVAAQTLGSEILFFSISGKILKKFGYGFTFTFCFVCYAIRLLAISLAPNPWWIVFIETFMQGPTYALCYTTIVAYASVVAPPGTSATVQGIVAGMDDGFGFALGSLIGGVFYKELGGTMTLRVFSLIAAVSAVMYLILHLMYLKDRTPETKTKVEWKSPKEAGEECVVAES